MLLSWLNNIVKVSIVNNIVSTTLLLTSTTLLQPVLNNREQVDDILRQPDDFYACTNQKRVGNDQY